MRRNSTGWSEGVLTRNGNARKTIAVGKTRKVSPLMKKII
jgi:hypothetical protein